MIRPSMVASLARYFGFAEGELDVMPMPWTPTSDAVIVRKFARPRPRRNPRTGNCG